MIFTSKLWISLSAIPSMQPCPSPRRWLWNPLASVKDGLRRTCISRQRRTRLSLIPTQRQPMLQRRLLPLVQTLLRVVRERPAEAAAVRRPTRSRLHSAPWLLVWASWLAQSFSLKGKACFITLFFYLMSSFSTDNGNCTLLYHTSWTHYCVWVHNTIHIQP